MCMHNISSEREKLLLPRNMNACVMCKGCFGERLPEEVTCRTRERQFERERTETKEVMNS